MGPVTRLFLSRSSGLLFVDHHYTFTISENLANLIFFFPSLFGSDARLIAIGLLAYWVQYWRCAEQ